MLQLVLDMIERIDAQDLPRPDAPFTHAASV
jgi:hypothetical protein